MGLYGGLCNETTPVGYYPSDGASNGKNEQRNGDWRYIVNISCII